MRVAFSLIGHKGWTGGSHYLRNLLAALHEVSRGAIEPYLFVGTNKMSEIDLVSPYISRIIPDKSFTEWSLPWIMRQALRRITDNDPVAENLCRQHGIDVVFHSGLFGTKFKIPCVNWLADFQHLHLPDMFTRKERENRSAIYKAFALQSKRLVVSSETAKKDFETFFPGYSVPVDVLRFVALVPSNVYEQDPRYIVSQYKVPDKFFYLPNQFWKHKNHAVVIEALKLIKKQNRKVFVVCTGNEHDYRNPDYIGFLKREASANKLADQIAFLGLIPMEHVYMFMRQSVSVLNPSFFEGWSTTVEETKSLGKKMILSDIPVHREQDPDGGTYFDPQAPEDLADKMGQAWDTTPPGPDFSREEKARSMLMKRMCLFGETFVDIIRKVVL